MSLLSVLFWGLHAVSVKQPQLLDNSDVKHDMKKVWNLVFKSLRVK